VSDATVARQAVLVKAAFLITFTVGLAYSRWGTQASCGHPMVARDLLQLNSLFPCYPEAKIILVHREFFTSKARALAKVLPFAYPDSSWLPLISHEMTRISLSQWIELTPANRLLWGGPVETTHGALPFAQDIGMQVFAKKVSKQTGDTNVACYLPSRISHRTASSSSMHLSLI